jgi:hypothetical protein
MFVLLFALAFTVFAFHMIVWVPSYISKKSIWRVTIHTTLGGTTMMHEKALIYRWQTIVLQRWIITEERELLPSLMMAMYERELAHMKYRDTIGTPLGYS